MEIKEFKRKLASIQKIEEIKLIEGADNIVAYRILGWWIVDKIGKYEIDDLVIFITIDSWIPNELAPFLTKNAALPRVYNNVSGERLKTIKLRGQVSQGLILPMSEQLNDAVVVYNLSKGTSTVVEEGADMTELLGIQKWEVPLHASLQGKAKGNFPTSLIPKTDQERIQNCFRDIQARPEATYEVTMKLDGSSMTIFRFEGQLRVCSRNLELKLTEENAGNTFVDMAFKLADQIPEGYAFQGELCGPSIQGNKEGFTDFKFFVFDIFNIKKYEYLSPGNRRNFMGEFKLDHVPVLWKYAKAPESVADGLALAEGPSINAKQREGLVWKCNEDPSFSYKTISNTWLLKNGE